MGIVDESAMTDVAWSVYRISAIDINMAHTCNSLDFAEVCVSVSRICFIGFQPADTLTNLTSDLHNSFMRSLSDRY